jgi:hypothetical protein
MTIEERAEKWAREHAPTRVDGMPLEDSLQFTKWLRDAYLAGSAQTQADYQAYVRNQLGDFPERNVTRP